jgi:SAM-dependent methyltransferase
MNEHVKQAVLRIASFPAYAWLYWRSMRRQGDRHQDREVLFREFVRAGPEESCLQIGVRGAKFGPEWVSVDLYDDSPEIDYHYDVADLHFGSETFDRVACNAILEHVVNPVESLRELRRVLKVGGQIWVEVPFHQPYHPTPHDYWRVSLEGLRVWMEGFREIQSGVYSIRSCFFYTGVFFWGEKTALDASLACPVPEGC